MAEPIRIDVEIETVDNTDPELSKVTKNLKNMKTAADSANTSTKKAGESVSKFDKSAQKTQKSLVSWAKQKYQILLEAKDKITPILSTLKGGLKSFTSKTWRVTMKAVDLITSPVRGILNLLRNPLFQAGAVLGVSFGVADTINTYKGFEAAMSQVQATSGATSTELTKLTAKAKEMGATTKFTAAESAEAFNYMAMAGWDAQQMTDGIEGILNLAAASGEDLATTSDIVTDALTAFGLKASDATHFSDVLAKAASSANTNVSMMGETFKYAGAMAGTLGYSIEDVGVMVGLMANSGIKASSAGTQLNSIFTRLSTNTNGATDAIKELGINFFDSSGNARDLSDVIDELRAATSGYTQEQKANLANTIAGTRAQAGLLAILNTTQEDYNKLTESINNADGAAARMSEMRLDNLSGDITLFQSAVDGLKISLGQRMSNSWLRDIVQWLTKQVPNVEQAFSEAMDFAEEKIDNINRKFKEISANNEWQNANFFGKAKILWDDFIVEPFSKWWNTKGKAKFAGFSQSIGEGIGKGLKYGIMTLLGIDIDETIDEGVSIGASFAKGFSSGFDADTIIGRLGEGIKNLFSNAIKLLPGGESAGLSSVFSAMLLAKMMKPLFGLGRGTFNMGKALFGSSGSALGGAPSLMGSLIGSTGNAMVAGSGMLGGLANVGYALNPGNTAGLYFGSTAGTMSGGMAALTGAGAVAGGLVAGASLISAGIDTYKAVKSDDKAERKAYGTSAAFKAGGVAAGAAIGTLILPGVGTLIGAGVGGIAGWLTGNKVKKDYQKNVEEMQALADKVQAVYTSTGVTIDKTTKFANQELENILNDSETSAEEFAKMFQESCAGVMKEAFGSIELSLTEIKKLAEEITFGDMKEGLDEFNTAVGKTENSLSSLKSSVTGLKRENWKVSLGMELSEIEVDEYKQTVNAFVQNAQDYINNSHYEATVALSLLTNGSGDTTSLDSMYNSFAEQVTSISEQLSSYMEIALSDGVITLDESAELINLQQQITDITNKLTEAQNAAELDAIGIKFKASGADLTPETFATLQEQLKNFMDDASESYYDAMTVSLANVDLQLSENAITEEQAAEMKRQIEDGYVSKMSDLNLNVETFNLQTIADAYGSQLDGILPEIEGTTAEKLQTAINNALLSKPDVDSWDESFMLDAFDLDGLSSELQANMESVLKTIAESVPTSVKVQILQSYKDSIPTTEEIMEAIDWDNFNRQMYEGIVGKQSGFSTKGSDWSILDPVLTGIPEEKLNTAMQNYAQNIHDALTNCLDPSVLSNFISTYITQAAVDIGNMASEFQGSAAGIGVAINTGIHNSVSGSSSLYRTDIQTELDIATTTPFNISPKVNVVPIYNVVGVPTLPSTPVRPSGHKATGGYVSGKQLSWVGEEGPEAIIPLVPSRRDRAMNLYEEVGRILGVGANANGGIIGSPNSASNLTDYNFFSEAIKTVPKDYNESTGGIIEDDVSGFELVSTSAEPGGNNNVEISVQVSPKFVIHATEGQSEMDIMEIIKKNMGTMADEIGGEVAERLKKVFSNMPTVKEA